MNKFFKICEDITFESIDNNIYILNIESGKYFSLSETASLIWQEIEKGHHIEDIKTNIKSRFGEDNRIDSDIDETISRFITLGLISNH